MKRFFVIVLLLIECSLLKAQRTRLRPYASVVTAGVKTYKGLFTVHTIKDSCFWEVPDSLLGREMMMISQAVVTPAGSGKAPSVSLLQSKLAGETLSNDAVYFGIGPDSALNIYKGGAHDLAETGSSLAGIITRSAVSVITASLPILARTPEGTGYVVDATAFIKAGKPGVQQTTSIDHIRAFPNNMEFGMYKAEGNTATSQEVSYTNFSFVALPKIPMQPRLMDKRVGFFSEGSGFTYFSDNQQKVDQWIPVVRWRMEPRPEDVERYQRGELVEPVKPIVIYIDPNTPKQWIKYLILGVDDWQKAFEQAGFKNAIMARECPADSSVDINDARYSFICYLASNTPNAYGPHVSDSRSGEIISTHIGWYHNVMTILDGWYKSQAGNIDSLARKYRLSDSLMGELIRFVSSHEIGHTLGLMHNHGASSQTPVAKLRDKDWLKIHGHTVSIMDYARFNYAAQPEDSIPESCIFPRIGEYDRWAIQWGYRYNPGLTVEQDRQIMSRLATDSLAGNPRLWFGNEESEVIAASGAMPNDPRIQSECLGDDNMEANVLGIRNFKGVLQTVMTWGRSDNGQYGEMAEVYNWTYKQYERFIKQAEAYLGGRERTWKTEETPGDVYAVTPKTLQKEALDFLNNELFSTPAWLMDEKILNKIQAPGNDIIQKMQLDALRVIMSTPVLTRLTANVNRFGSDSAYSLEEYVADLHKCIWADIGNGRTIDADRRNLQRCYINNLAAIVLSPNQNIRETDYWALLYNDLVRIGKEISAALPVYPSGNAKSHLISLKYRIDKIID